jgi:formate-dependent nitrite reductase membrane component NrfD
VLEARPSAMPRLGTVSAAVLVLVGGFLLRVVFLLGQSDVSRGA